MLHNYLYKETGGLTEEDFTQIDVQAQVVAGINYKFQLYLEDVIFEIVLWRKLDGTVKVTSSEIIPVPASTEDFVEESDTEAWYEEEQQPEEEQQF